MRILASTLVAMLIAGCAADDSASMDTAVEDACMRWCLAGQECEGRAGTETCSLFCTDIYDALAPAGEDCVYAAFWFYTCDWHELVDDCELHQCPAEELAHQTECGR